MGAESSRSRLTPIGLSVLVNLALLGLMACTLSTPRVTGERYIAVELRAIRPRNVQHPTSNVQLPMPVQRPAVSSQRSGFNVQRSRPEVRRPRLEVESSKLEVGSSLPRLIELQGPIAPGLPSGGGTQATGLGAFVGPGSGGGITGSGEGLSGTPRPDPTPNTQHPTPYAQLPTSNFQPPTSTAAGESRAPSVAKQTKPVYPSDAREDGVEGISTVLALIDPEGKVTGTRLEKSSGDRRLDQSALDAVSKWTYNPCLRDGVPVKSSVRVKVEFRLE